MKIKQKLKIKGKNTPVFIEGEENGVIATQVVELPDDYSPIDIGGLLDAEQHLIDKNIEVISEETE